MRMRTYSDAVAIGACIDVHHREGSHQRQKPLLGELLLKRAGRTAINLTDSVADRGGVGRRTVLRRDWRIPAPAFGIQHTETARDGRQSIRLAAGGTLGSLWPLADLLTLKEAAD